MSGMDIKLDTKALDALIKKMDGKADNWLRGVAGEMANDIKLKFNTGPRGRMYVRGKRKVHYASTAGNPPNVDMGTLRASIRAIRKGNLHYWVADGTDYGMALEMGTTRIAPRPFVRPVFEEWRNGKLAKSAEAWIAK